MTEADFDSDKEIQLARWIQKNLRDDWNVIDVFVYADGTVSTIDSGGNNFSYLACELKAKRGSTSKFNQIKRYLQSRQIESNETT